MARKKTDAHALTEFHGMLTRAPIMFRLFERIERVARTDASVLVRGETGSGKELVARAIHDLSPRASAPFAAVNCATFTAELLTSELFGHVRGAFTGAIKDRPGLFKLNDGGTVFLDELAEMPMDVQAQLLRVLESKTFVPLGGSEPVQVNVRVLSATHRSLRREVEQGTFREDLMYRVRVVPLFIPALREREGDIEALTDYFIAAFNEQGFRVVEKVDPSAREAMHSYPWPGNVRELHNAIEHAFAIGEGPRLTLDDLPPELRGEEPPGEAPATSDLRDIERGRILAALRQTHGKKGEAAELLGMSRSTLWRKLRELRIA